MIEINNLNEIKQIMLAREMGGKALYYVACYLIDGMLIDTGCEYTKHELADYLKNEQIKFAVNTHFHEDHVGANRLLQKTFHLDIFAHKESVPRIREKISLNQYQEIVWGYPEPSEVYPLSDKANTLHHVFHIVDTPGHTPDHIAIIEPKKGWCFSGDLFVSETPKTIRPDEDLGGIILSMNKLIDHDLGWTTMYTSIGKVVENGRCALGNCVEHLKGLYHQVMDFNSQGLSNPEIVKKVFGKESSLKNLTGGHYSCENMVSALIGLDKKVLD